MERRVSSASMMTGLGGVVKWGLSCRRVMVDVCKTEAQSGAMVALAAGLARIVASIYTLELGWLKMVEAISGECAQGALSGVRQWPVDG